MINFAGQLSEAEFRRAQWLSSPKIVRWFGWLIVLALFMVLMTGGLQPILSDPVTNLIKLGAVLIFGVFAIVAPRRAVTRVWRTTPLLHEPVEGSLHEIGITWRTPSSDSSYTWDKLVRQKSSEDIILLYTSVNQALIMPRSYFSGDDEWARAREAVAQKLPAA